MSDHQNKTKQSHRFIVLSLLVIFILCVATAVRIYRLDRQSFWLDEAYTAQKADLSATEIIENFQKEDSNPPTYLIAIKVWKQIFPQSNFSLRMSSCIFGILSILMAYLFIREISGKKTAILVAALMAVSPYHLWYSHELRMYTMLCAVVLAALFCLVKAAKNGKQLYWALYVILAVIGFYLHLGAAITILCFNLWLLLNRSCFKIGRAWLITAILIAVLCAPWAVFLKQQSDAKIGSRTDIKKSINPAHAAYVYYEFFFGRSTGPSINEIKKEKSLSVFKPHIPVIAAYAAVFGTACLLGMVAAFKKRGNFKLFLCMVIAPVVLLVVLATLTPLPLHGRNIIPALPFFLLLPAWGILGKGPAWARGALAVCIVTLSLYAIYNYNFDSRHYRDDYQSTAKFISLETHGDAVIAIDYTTGFKYYGIDTERIFFVKGSDEKLDENLETTCQYKHRAWLITITPEIHDPKHRALKYLQDHYPEISDLAGSFPGVGIRCFDAQHPIKETQK